MPQPYSRGMPPEIFRFRLLEVPDVSCVVGNCAVCGESACACDIVQGLLVPLKLVSVNLADVVLSAAVAVEVCQRHVEILVSDGVRNFLEGSAVDALYIRAITSLITWLLLM